MKELKALRKAFDNITHLSLEIWVEDADLYNPVRFKSFLPASLESLSLKFHKSFDRKLVSIHQNIASAIVENKIKSLKLNGLIFFSPEIEETWAKFLLCNTSIKNFIVKD